MLHLVNPIIVIGVVEGQVIGFIKFGMEGLYQVLVDNVTHTY